MRREKAEAETRLVRERDIVRLQRLLAGRLGARQHNRRKCLTRRRVGDVVDAGDAGACERGQRPPSVLWHASSTFAAWSGGSSAPRATGKLDLTWVIFMSCSTTDLRSADGCARGQTVGNLGERVEAGRARRRARGWGQGGRHDSPPICSLTPSRLVNLRCWTAKRKRAQGQPLRLLVVALRFQGG